MEKEEIIKEYVRLSKIKDEYIKDFNHKKSNIATRKMIALDKKIKVNSNIAYSIIDELRNNDSMSLKIWINELSFELNYECEQSIQNLMLLIEENKNNLFSIDIKMYLVDKKIIKNWL